VKPGTLLFDIYSMPPSYPRWRQILPLIILPGLLAPASSQYIPSLRRDEYYRLANLTTGGDVRSFPSSPPAVFLSSYPPCSSWTPPAVDHPHADIHLSPKIRQTTHSTWSLTLISASTVQPHLSAKSSRAGLMSSHGVHRLDMEQDSSPMGHYMESHT